MFINCNYDRLAYTHLCSMAPTKYNKFRLSNGCNPKVNAIISLHQQIIENAPMDENIEETIISPIEDTLTALKISVGSEAFNNLYQCALQKGTDYEFLQGVYDQIKRNQQPCNSKSEQIISKHQQILKDLDMGKEIRVFVTPIENSLKKLGVPVCSKAFFNLYQCAQQKGEDYAPLARIYDRIYVRHHM